MQEQARLRSARFRAEREADWKRLDAIVTRAEKQGVRSLNFDDARDLATLYRQAANSLSVAREISLDKSLLTYLEALTARACLSVYAPQETLSGVVTRFLTIGAPQAMRRCFGHILLAFLAMGLGALAGAALYFESADWYGLFMPGEMIGGRSPLSTVDELKESIYQDDVSGLDQLSAFASYLFSHNTRIAIFVFALGAFAGIMTFWLTFYNGLIIGAFVALHIDKGLAWDIFGWLSIHGVTELSAIIVAAGAGFRLGSAVLFPGRRTRRDALRHNGRDAVKLALVAAIMLIAAAVLEGFGRQLVQDTSTRLIIGWGVGALWLAWFTLAGRRA
ncbi:MAG: stage II sporulation protein M [Pikeienuella sp.]